MENNIIVKTRFAPSPTGDLHIGGARTALFNYLWARHYGGEFFLRFEDTDRERSRAAFEHAIERDLLWLGIEWSGAAIRQSDRFPRYAEVLKRLADAGAVYPCFCAEEEHAGGFHVYDGKCRDIPRDAAERRIASGEPHCWRLRFGDTISFNDMLRGEIVIPADSIGDFVICRSGGVPTYLFAVVADDHDMDITHVIRGEEHISNTPKQEAVYHALGWTPPQWAHIPMVLGEDRRKLSKRTGSASIAEFRDAGWLPGALTSYLATLSWHKAPTDRIATLEESAAMFDIADVALSSPVHDAERLRFFGKKSLDLQGREELAAMIASAIPKPSYVHPDDWFALVGEIAPQCASIGELAEAMRSALAPCAVEYPRPSWLPELAAKFEGLPQDDWRNDAIANVLKTFRKENNLKGAEFFHALRLFVTGVENGPPLSLIFACAGREKTMRRFSAVI